MKPVGLLLLFFIPAFLHSQSANSLNLSDHNGRKKGHWVYYGKDRPELKIAPDGKVEEGDYINDRKEGTWIKYHKDGKTPKLIGEYRNNRPCGRYWKFWESGQLMESGSFNKNKSIDTTKKYNARGCLIEEHANRFDRFRDTAEQIIVVGVYDNYSVSYFDKSGQKVCGPVKLLDSRDNLITLNNEECGVPRNNTKDSTYRKRTLLPADSIPPVIQNSTKALNPNFVETGYNKVYNADKEIWMDGYFLEGKLEKGKVYFYDRDGILLWVRIYEKGRYVKEGQL